MFGEVVPLRAPSGRRRLTGPARSRGLRPVAGVSASERRGRHDTGAQGITAHIRRRYGLPLAATTQAHLQPGPLLVTVYLCRGACGPSRDDARRHHEPAAHGQLVRPRGRIGTPLGCRGRHSVRPTTGLGSRSGRLTVPPRPVRRLLSPALIWMASGHRSARSTWRASWDIEATTAGVLLALLEATPDTDDSPFRTARQVAGRTRILPGQPQGSPIDHSLVTD